VQLDFDASTSTFHSQISNAQTGIALVDEFTPLTGLTPTDVAYNSIALFGGETGDVSSRANQAVVDNVRFSVTGAPVPVPAAVWLLISGIVGLAAVRRHSSGIPCGRSHVEVVSVTVFG
jgi:hypothetical protein